MLLLSVCTKCRSQTAHRRCWTVIPRPINISALMMRIKRKFSRSCPCNIEASYLPSLPWLPEGFLSQSDGIGEEKYLSERRNRRGKTCFSRRFAVFRRPRRERPLASRVCQVSIAGKHFFLCVNGSRALLKIILIKMNKFNMFITAVCVLFVIKARWPRNKSTEDFCLAHALGIGFNFLLRHQ